MYDNQLVSIIGFASKLCPHFGHVAMSFCDMRTLPKKRSTNKLNKTAAPTCPRDANQAQKPIDAVKDKNIAMPTIVVFIDFLMIDTAF